MLSPAVPANDLGFPVYGRYARISRPKVSGVGRHEGVLLPTGAVAHTTPEHGPHLCSLQQFSRELPVQVEKELPILEHTPAMAVVQGLLFKHEPYDLWNNNCEIFARKALLEKPSSPQVLGWALVAIVAGLLYVNSQ